jgi:hypothetical protein
MTACPDRDRNLRLATQLFDHEDDIERLPKAPSRHRKGRMRCHR